MTDHEASRTLVKSPPELWAECSDAASLARHLGEFGEIKITRLEPESAVAWEGEKASGTVRIEPSAWGTKVTLTAQLEAVPAPEPLPSEPPPSEPPPAPELSPAQPLEPSPPARGLLARWRVRWRAASPPSEPPRAVAEPEPPESEPPESEPPLEPPVPSLDPGAVLTAALESLGQAHHRPYSRA